MKFAYVFLVVSSITVSGCSKKDYSCKCDGGLTGNGMQIEIKQTKKSTANKACKGYEGNPAVDGFTNCRLL